ncbi:geranylgeranyl reductase family protein [Cryomorphaceae bacterium]|nr:geranylgeranyl reductase family protein [Cryomorphaceae bacterium]
MPQKTRKIVDVAIIGAGPAGCAAALALKDSGLEVALIDRSEFPRDKVCGDAIPAKSFQYVNDLVPSSSGVFSEVTHQKVLESYALYWKGRQIWNKKFFFPMVNIARKDFDNYLLESVKKHTQTGIHLGVKVNSISREEDGLGISNNDQESILSAKIVAFANGSTSRLFESTTQKKIELEGYGSAVRQYFKNVRLDQKKNHIFLPSKQKVPGYFWVFPLGNNVFNVGYGGWPKKPMSFKKEFQRILAEDSSIGQYFEHAEPLDSVRGHKIPFHSNVSDLVGERCLVLGDAAGFVDPMDGHGIDNALLSGMLAAESISASLKGNEFDQGELDRYMYLVESQIYPKLNRNLSTLKRIYPFVSGLQRLRLI